MLVYRHMDIKNELTQACTELAQQAGLELRKQYAQQSSSNATQRSSPKGLKLIEDKTINEWLITQIAAHYPDHGIYSEESDRKDGNPTWIIDPIDGSVNFSTHNPFFSISLAVMIDDIVEIGVIEAPLLQEQFVAVRGEGATVNGQPIHVSKTVSLHDSYMISCDGGVEDRTEVFSTIIRNYYDQVKDFRKLGSAALECAWVATGRADSYLTMAIDAWDVAAGVLLIQEAGGKVTTFDGSDWSPIQLDIVCSNGLLHEEIMSRMWS